MNQSLMTLTETSARYNQAFDNQIVGLLDRICVELEITDAMFKLAEERYQSIAQYLDEDESPLRQFRPIIYPQGSINIGTTVKPIGDAEYDVDVICQLAV